MPDALDTVVGRAFDGDDLRQAVRDYISECDNPVPDYSHRRTLRNRLRELAGCPTEPTRS